MDRITRVIRTENGDFLNVTYERIRDEFTGKYGLRLREVRTTPEKLTEIPNITGNSLEIDELIVVLSRCSVTSATIHDILEDFRADCHK